MSDQNELTEESNGRPLSLAERVRNLEAQRHAFRRLAGEMRATIHINRVRGTLNVADGPSGAVFDRLESGWKRTFDHIEKEFPTE